MGIRLSELLADSFDDCFGGGDAPYEILEDMYKNDITFEEIPSSKIEETLE